jgi:multidrug efflux pump subunit AcrB
MDALYEAIILVVIVAWLGFREWRSAMLIAISMPLTLAMTFGMMFALGLDLQQVSIATLIIALGLLVDDPVVAGDAIKHDLGLGHPPQVAAWLGPTKLARPILFATITNVAAYLPFLLLKGDTYNFLYSLPIVMTCALVASRIVSMTFVPHLGYYLMRPNEKAELPIEEKRKQGFTGFYYQVGSYALNHRWQVFLGSLVFLATGAFLGQQLKTSYFPDDVQYLAFADLWLPNSAAISKTNQLEMQAERVIADAAAKYGRAHPEHGKPRKILKSVTSFVGGGGPRFWFSVSPESQQPAYAQLVMEIYDKEDMPKLAGPLQEAVSAAIPGAWLDVQQLQTNPVKYPLEILISGRTDISAVREAEDIATLRRIGSEVTDILRSVPITRRIRDDWGSESPVIRLNIDADRANMAGITNDDVAQSSEAGISGAQAGTMIEGDERIPIVARLRREQRGLIGDIKNLYVYSQTGTQKVPLQSIAALGFRMETQRIVRRDHFNTMTVFGYPATGVLPSEVMNEAQPKLEALKRTLPPGYSIQVGGEAAKQSEGFGQLTLVLVVSVALIFLALVIQFNNTVKPILVFAAVPYGAVGAIAALWFTSTPFGFMAFLGIASLVGVIVSHVIVLFEFVEEMERRGEPLVQGLLDAGIERLRPVMITVGATILALFPLAIHGGPLWQPLCFAQIGGLSLATIIELLLIKVLYSIFVRDLKILSWGEEAPVATVKAA